ncbi:MAG TPA: hypothetical protein VNF71_00075 [Acidimicrobiales bacterium]|nr:hypothetical protein [Acidimicrobiales bacterium]
MSAQPDVKVSQESEGGYRVEVRGSGATTSHVVSVPAGFATELGWGRKSEAELVRESFAFLLEREPPSSILRSFSLDVIGRYFPEYPAEIASRLPR